MADGRTRIRKILKPAEQKAEQTDSLRVCAYCRVSTRNDEQATSYKTQVSAYTRKINDTPDWEFAGIYADWGISGTQAKKRPEFLRMIRDCREGKIDVILCKSISRFARNTLDAVNSIRMLQEMGVRLIFEKEGLDMERLSRR